MNLIIMNRCSLRNLALAGAATVMLGACAADESAQPDRAENTQGAIAEQQAAASCQAMGWDKNMAAEIAEDLCDAFRENEGDAEYRERVIVTLDKDADRLDLAMEGFEIISVMDNVPIIVGNITAEGLKNLAAREGIVKIECDGEMRIMEN